MSEPPYPTDLSDAEWAILAPLLAPRTRRGRPRTHDRRSVLDAILYVLRGGLAWRLLPERFPLWRAVYDQFRRWRRAGTWRRINDALRERARELAGRKPRRGRRRRSSTAKQPGRAKLAASAATTAASG